METTRLFDFLYNQKERFPQKDALVYKASGEWNSISTEKVIEEAEKTALGLRKAGIVPGDKVAIVAFNRPEWMIVDLGIQLLGAISVPLYPTITEADYQYIFNQAEVKFVFADNEDLYKKVKNAAATAPTVENICTFDTIEGAMHWSEVGKSAEGEDPQSLNASKAAVKKDDLATIIYTSGTTGSPKGVMLTHDNIGSNVKACVGLLPINKESRVLSFLPLCHVFERMVTYVYIYAGASVYYAESLDTIGENIKEVQPNFFTCVPRLLEKVFDKIVAKGNELTGIKKKLFFWALKLTDTYKIQGNSAWYKFKLSIADKLIFSKWRAALGGRVDGIVSGSAALQPRLARIFWAAGIKIMEGYGLTETSPVISVSLSDPDGCRFGTVGPVIPGVEVKIAEDGEILTRGPHITKGYYKQPELTAEVIDKEGWFHTGDIGEFVEGRFLKITDRKKEMFKTSGGKYIAPQLMENKFKESKYIDQIMVVGEGERFAAALIVPSFDELKHWCEESGVEYSEPAELIQHEKIKVLFDSEKEKYNENFASWETIKKYRLIPQVWTPETGELTPTLKLKRKIIYEKYKKEIKEIFE